MNDVMKEDEFPGSLGVAKIGFEPTVLRAARVVTMSHSGIHGENDKVRVAVIEGVEVFRAGNVVGREIERGEIVGLPREAVMVAHRKKPGNGTHLFAVDAEAARVGMGR